MFNIFLRAAEHPFRWFAQDSRRAYQRRSAPAKLLGLVDLFPGGRGGRNGPKRQTAGRDSRACSLMAAERPVVPLSAALDCLLVNECCGIGPLGRRRTHLARYITADLTHQVEQVRAACSPAPTQRRIVPGSAVGQLSLLVPACFDCPERARPSPIRTLIPSTCPRAGRAA